MKANPDNIREFRENVNEELVLSHYFNIKSLPVLVNSPLRADNHPSFWIYLKEGKVRWLDYATGERGDLWNLLQSYYHLTLKEVVRKVSMDKVFQPSSLLSSSKAPKVTSTGSELKVKIREWKEHDIKYWESYGIPLPWLRYAEVYPISHKIIYKDDHRYVFPAALYAYAFVERKEGNVTIKVYQPYAKKYKWSNSNDGSVVGLWAKMPAKGAVLCICSSLKDALCLWANIGIPCVYVQSETTGISLTARKVLESRFKRICICFDNDTPGIEDGKRLSKATGYENIVIPQFDGGKDISDAFKTMGKEKFINFIKPLFDGKQKGKECHTNNI